MSEALKLVKIYSLDIITMNLINTIIMAVKIYLLDNNFGKLTLDAIMKCLNDGDGLLSTIYFRHLALVGA